MLQPSAATKRFNFFAPGGSRAHRARKREHHDEAKITSLIRRRIRWRLIFTIPLQKSVFSH